MIRTRLHSYKGFSGHVLMAPYANVVGQVKSQRGQNWKAEIRQALSTCLTVETIIDLRGGFNWLRGLSSAK